MKMKSKFILFFCVLCLINEHPMYASPTVYYTELLMIVTYDNYVSFNRSLDSIYRFCVATANQVNTIYRPLNVQIILTDILVWNRRNLIDIDIDSRSVLTRFANYRQLRLNKQFPYNDHAILLTNHTFKDNVVGCSTIHFMCSSKHSVSIVNIETDVIVTAELMAHELGHNFGMKHDNGGLYNGYNEPCLCDNIANDCIMNHIQSYRRRPARWSSCSINVMRKNLHNFSCLHNVPNLAQPIQLHMMSLDVPIHSRLPKRYPSMLSTLIRNTKQPTSIEPNITTIDPIATEMSSTEDNASMRKKDDTPSTRLPNKIRNMQSTQLFIIFQLFAIGVCLLII